MTSRLKLLASGMIALGALLAIIGFASGGRWLIVKDNTGFHAPNEQSLVTKSHTLDAFTSINLFNEYGDVQILPADDYSLEVHAPETTDVTYAVEDGELTVKIKNANKNRLTIGFSSFESPSIKIYVPTEATLTKIVLDTNFGDVQLQALNYQQLNLFVKHGDIVFKNIGAEQTEITQSFGDTTLHQFTSTGFVIDSGHGDIEIDGELNGQTTITSSFGDIDLQLHNKKGELGLDLNTNFGDITLNKQTHEGKLAQLYEGDHQLKVSQSHGDLELSLE